jgi:hypothetical protein
LLAHHSVKAIYSVNKMAAKRKAWMPTPPKRTKSQVPDSTKRVLQNKAQELIANTLKPAHIKPPPTGNDFNYLADIYAKWHRNYFYFCAKYNCPSTSASVASFETKFARMEYVGNEKFNLSYMRHTDKWWEIYQELPMPECLRAIAEEPHFVP